MGEALEKIQLMRAAQLPKEMVFERARTWLSSRSRDASAPRDETDWVGLSETAFWIGRLRIETPLCESVQEAEIVAALQALPLNDAADLVFGLAIGLPDKFMPLYARCRPQLLNRIRSELDVLRIEENVSEAVLHFLVFTDLPACLDAARNIEDPWQSGDRGSNGAVDCTPEQEFDPLDSSPQQSHDGTKIDTRGTKGNTFNYEAVRRISVSARLLPDKPTVGTRGYGHLAGGDSLPFDPTEKRALSLEKLPSRWLTWINATFRALGNFPNRPADWQEFANQIVDLRRRLLSLGESLLKALDGYYQKKRTRLFGKHLKKALWQECQYRLREPVLFPQCAVDPWGLVQESSAGAIERTQRTNQGVLLESRLSIEEYSTLQQALQRFTSAFSNFLSQGFVSLQTIPLYRVGDPAERDELAQEILGSGTHRLSFINLSNALEHLSLFQQEFRHRVGHLLSQADLKELERTEQDIMVDLWAAWYLFVFEPRKQSRRFSSIASAMIEKKREAVAERIRRRLEEMSSSDIGIRLRDDNVMWEQKSALWIVMDGVSALEPYEALESLVSAVREELLEVSRAEMRREAIDVIWKNIVIVPIVRGRTLFGKGWPISTSVLLYAETLGWWNFVERPLGEDALQTLGVNSWESPRLQELATFIQAYADISVVSGHLLDLKRVGTVDDESVVQVNRHLSSVARHVIEKTENLLEAISRFVSFHESMTEEEIEQRIWLCKATLEIGKAGSILAADLGSIVDSEITTERIWQFASSIYSVQPHVDLFTVCWATDIVLHLPGQLNPDA